MELREMVRRLKAGQGIRRIYAATGVHRTIIRALRDTAEAQRWPDTDSPLPSEEEVRRARRTEVPAESAAHPLEAFREQIEQWVQAGHSYVVMHQLIKDRYACSEATLRPLRAETLPRAPPGQRGPSDGGRPGGAPWPRLGEPDGHLGGPTYGPMGR